ncbi:hypothetical protein, partial [Butyricicoccus sp.]|uniref:hypothetical protein n=1 Tax=Butyricicoccus sp. TaxID=2049021 RepID=UPI003736ED26
MNAVNHEKIPRRKIRRGIKSSMSHWGKQTDLFVWLFVLAGASRTFLLPSFSFCKEKRGKTYLAALAALMVS